MLGDSPTAAADAGRDLVFRRPATMLASRFPVLATGSTVCVSSLADSVRGMWISTKNNEILTRDERDPPSPSLLEERPSCIFIGPIKTASKETLEALYLQIGSLDPSRDLPWPRRQ
ncbi:hypothetical protein U1Q18_013503 [Sarracenia purpurea var. burkii]